MSAVNALADRLGSPVLDSGSAAGKCHLGASQSGGVAVPVYQPENDRVQRFQADLASKPCAMWLAAGNGVTVTTIGAFALTPIGTATAASVTTANVHTRTRRVDYRAASATSAIAGFRYNALQWSLGMLGVGGFRMVLRFGVAAGATNPTKRAFFGMQGAVTTPVSVDPTTLTNIVGIGWNTNDKNFYLISRGATGAVTKIDLGIPVPSSDGSDIYELVLHSSAIAARTEVGCTLTSLGTGRVAHAKTDVNLPAAPQLLAPRAWIAIGSTASAPGLSLSTMSIEG